MGGLNVLRAAVEAGCLPSRIRQHRWGALRRARLPALRRGPPAEAAQPVRPEQADDGALLPPHAPPAGHAEGLALGQRLRPRASPRTASRASSRYSSAACLRGEPVTIDGDGQQTRDFVYVGDVAAAHELALGHPELLTANIGSGTGVSVNEIFERDLQADRLRTPSSARTVSPGGRQARRARRHPRARTPRLVAHDRPCGWPPADRRGEATTLMWLLATAPVLRPRGKLHRIRAMEHPSRLPG